VPKQKYTLGAVICYRTPLGARVRGSAPHKKIGLSPSLSQGPSLFFCEGPLHRHVTRGPPPPTTPLGGWPGTQHSEGREKTPRFGP
jgi:hypothetical protein